jgi:hypothetical protein
MTPPALPLPLLPPVASKGIQPTPWKYTSAHAWAF